MATSGKDKEMGEAFDANSSLKDGPAKNRGCTDVICIPIFLLHIVAFYVLTFMNAGKADPMKLIKPMDYRGGFCGIKKDSQWKGEGTDERRMNLENYPKMMWSMNVDALFGMQAKTIVCNGIGKSYLVGTGQYQITETAYNSFCGITSGNTIEALANASAELANTVSNTIEAFSDPTKAAQIFTTGQSKIGSSMMKEITKNFNMICATSCDLSQSTPNMESWTYTPSKSVLWGTDPSMPAYSIWSSFVARVELDGAGTLLNAFKFKAWPSAVCPYEDKRFCIPSPGVVFTEPGDWNTCMPKISQGVADAAGAAAEKTLNGLASLSVTEGAQKTLGDVIGDILKTWQVFLIVAVLSFVVGLIVLVLMRFILAPLVWLSIFLVLILLVGGGLLLFIRAGQCKGQSFESATQSASSQWQSGSVDLPECAEYGGFSIEHDDARHWTKIASYVIMGVGGLYFLGVLCMCCRIRLAIAVNQVACEFMYKNPGAMFVPIVQNLISFVWILFWVFCAAFILSTVPDDYVPSSNYRTYDEAFGTASTAGKCTDSWPTGGAYLGGDSECKMNAQNQDMCYKCSAPRFTFGWPFLYAFFAYMWHTYFIIAVGQCTIAGAVGVWFFSKDKNQVFRSTITTGLKNALWYHSGSLAFGSMILAIITTIKWFMHFLAKQAEQQKNPVAQKIFQCLGYCIWCFEKCVKFLNKNAYIQIALMGTNFCKSAKNAFWLILRNALRFMVICMLSFAVHFLAMVLIVALTAVAGYFILQAMYSDVNPLTPCVIFGFIGYFTAKLFVGVFALSVDSCLQCFIAAEEMGCGSVAPQQLQKFLADHPSEKEGMCDACCCTVM